MFLALFLPHGDQAKAHHLQKKFCKAAAEFIRNTFLQKARLEIDQNGNVIAPLERKSPVCSRAFVKTDFRSTHFAFGEETEDLCQLHALVEEVRQKKLTGYDDIPQPSDHAEDQTGSVAEIPRVQGNVAHEKKRRHIRMTFKRRHEDHTYGAVEGKGRTTVCKKKDEVLGEKAGPNITISSAMKAHVVKNVEDKPGIVLILKKKPCVKTYAMVHHGNKTLGASGPKKCAQKFSNGSQPKCAENIHRGSHSKCAQKCASGSNPNVAQDRHGGKIQIPSWIPMEHLTSCRVVMEKLPF